MAHHPLSRRGDVVHHYFPHGKAVDLVPFCGVTPGPDEDGVWHTAHGISELFEHNAQQNACCSKCLGEAARVAEERQSGPQSRSSEDPSA